MKRFFKSMPPALTRASKLHFKHFINKYDLNLIVCRNVDSDYPNTFKDTLHVIHHNDLYWEEFIFPCSSTAGEFWLKNTKRRDGTAILKHDHQYLGAYTFGSHKGKYECLVPTRQMTIWRDPNRDSVLDYDVTEGTSASCQIHKAGKSSFHVDKWSAGCIVVQNGFDEFMELCKLQESWGRGNKFSLTILRGLWI